MTLLYHEKRISLNKKWLSESQVGEGLHTTVFVETGSNAKMLQMLVLKRALRFFRRHRSAFIIWGIGACFALGGLFALWVALLRIPDLASLQDRRIEQSLKIYDRTGQVLLYDLNQNVRRTVVPLSQISPLVQNATVSIEDPDFYTHVGFKPTAFLRALFANVTSLGYSQGGSTITQQAVKLTILTGRKTIARKVEEIILALKLERVLDKQQILQVYLNAVPYGGSIYGTEEASEDFFGKHASDVTLPEAAYLAAVLPAPTYYSPWGNHRASLDARKNLVLDKMFEHGYITAGERDEAKLAQVVFQTEKPRGISAPHFVFFVEQYLESKYGQDALRTAGWRVITTLDADLQVKAEETVKANALENTKKFNATNMGLVALNPQNGQILSMVGSRNYFDTEIPGAYNITLASRQPGSTFKPFAYAEAFIKGYTPDTVLFDLPTQFSTNCSPSDTTTATGAEALAGGCYAPVDYDGKWRGPMTLRNAIAQSINVPSIEVLYLAGIADTLQLAKSMGISTLGDPNRYGLTLVLGGGEVTLLDITSAYGGFANNGVHYPASSILKVEDTQGNVIEDNTEPQGGSQVLDPRVAQQINDVLSDNVARGPLGENNLFSFGSRDVAVKTGTTNNYRDAWTIGYTPNIVVGVWAGNNDNTPMEKRVSGFIVGPAWSEVMRYALGKLPVESFSRSDIEQYTNTKPVMNGIWQGGEWVPGGGVICNVHSILYWVDKKNPTGPSPGAGSQDSQFRFWEYPVEIWAAQNGCAPGTLVPIGNSATYQVPQSVPATPQTTQPVFYGGSIIPQ